MCDLVSETVLSEVFTNDRSLFWVHLLSSAMTAFIVWHRFCYAFIRVFVIVMIAFDARDLLCINTMTTYEAFIAKRVKSIFRCFV